jgi:hypothetical protein
MKNKNLTEMKNLFIVAFLLFSIPCFIYAETVKLVNPLGENSTIDSVLKKVMGWLVQLGAPLATVMIIIGGIQMLFSGGNPEKFKKGQQTILYTAIGYGIILLGTGLIEIIEALLKS